ncbi:MAG: FAD:protein FMN transferase [Cyclobacteriaceae bacterium]
MRQIIALSLIILFSLPAQSQELYRYTFQEPHMGTYFKIIIYAEDRQFAIDVAKAAYDSVASLNQVLSDYLPHSEVSEFNNAPVNTPRKISPALFTAIKKSLQLSEWTNGAFDITVGPLVKLWRKARKENELPGRLDLQSALHSVGYQHLQLSDSAVIRNKPGMQLDFGGIGKGMALSAAMRVINTAGISRVLLDAGGDILLGEAPPDKSGWEVVIGLFEQDKKFQQKMLLSNMAVTSSGDLYQFIEIEGKRYSHIVDPSTGLGITGQKRSTIIGPDAATADALASAICIMKPGKARKLLKKFPEYQALLFASGSRNQVKVPIGKNILK